MKSTSFSLFDHVGNTKLLSREEEIELSKKIEKGDSVARDKMIRANLRLALSVVKKYTNRGVDIDDLFQESVLGLTRAVDQFTYIHNNPRFKNVLKYCKSASKRRVHF